MKLVPWGEVFLLETDFSPSDVLLQIYRSGLHGVCSRARVDHVEKYRYSRVGGRHVVKSPNYFHVLLLGRLCIYRPFFLQNVLNILRYHCGEDSHRDRLGGGATNRVATLLVFERSWGELKTFLGA